MPSSRLTTGMLLLCKRMGQPRCVDSVIIIDVGPEGVPVLQSNCICMAPRVRNTNELANLGLAEIKTTVPRQKVIDIRNIEYKNTTQTHKLLSPSVMQLGYRRGLVGYFELK